MKAPEYKIIDDPNDPRQSLIVWNDVEYGTWTKEANSDFPEDLTLNRELPYLIDTGVKIGVAYAADQLKEAVEVLEELVEQLQGHNNLGHILGMDHERIVAAKNFIETFKQ